MKKIFLLLAALSVGAYFYYGKTRQVEIPKTYSALSNILLYIE